MKKLRNINGRYLCSFHVPSIIFSFPDCHYLKFNNVKIHQFSLTEVPFLKPIVLRLKKYLPVYHPVFF